MSNQRFENSGSEDGQLRSPGDNDDDLLSGEDAETADSLDIKPPQAVRVSSNRKHAFKEKKHSREHRHKDRDRDRERMIRDREKERMIDDRRHRHGTGGAMIRDRHSKRDRNERHQQYHEQRERDHQPQQPQQQREYHRNQHKDRERDKRQIAIRENRERERDRRKQTTEQHHYETKADAERALEDLRSRLLSKRHKYEKELSHYNESAADYYESRTAVVQDGRREKDGRDRRANIEIIDSPEHYTDFTTNRPDKKEKKSTSEDPELASRRARLLEAERQITKRKELAREELEARREMLRERIQHKRHHLEDKLNRKHKRSRKSPKEDGEFDDKEIINVPDNDSDESSDDDDDDDDEEEEEEEGEIDSESETDSGSESEPEHVQKAENDEDDVLPVSPLSVGELAKSERRRRSAESQSPQSARGSRSRSRSEHSQSNCSHSTVRSSSKSTSRSRSRSRSPMHSKSRSRSRSLSVEDDKREKDRKDDDDDIDAEMKDTTNDVKKEEEEPEPKGDTSPVNEKGEKLPNYYPGIQGCRSVEEFQCLNRIEEGTYGVVYRAKDKRTNEIVALKRLKMEKEKEGFPITSLREINTLLKGQHPNIVTVREIVVGSNMDKIFIVMDYVEHDLKSLMETMKQKEQTFFPGEVKCLMQQLLRAVGHLHDNWILHRDLKTSNLLLSHKGILKVGDFGLAREYGSPLKAYTSLVVTLWYRAPELLLCTKEYSTPIDIWSVGCIFAEFLQMGPLFPGKTEMDQLNKIFKDLGTPNEKIWPGYKDLPAVQNMLSQNSHFTEYPVSNLKRKFFNKATELGIGLLQGLLTYDPKQRLTAELALKSPYFKELPLPIDPSMFPTWPAKSELGARKALASSPKPPSGGSQFKQLGRDDIPIQSAASSSKTGFVLNANIDQRQLAMAPGFSLKF